jgi:hypothetical protein
MLLSSFIPESNFRLQATAGDSQLASAPAALEPRR